MDSSVAEQSPVATRDASCDSVKRVLECSADSGDKGSDGEESLKFIFWLLIIFDLLIFILSSLPSFLGFGGLVLREEGGKVEWCRFQISSWFLYLKFFYTKTFFSTFSNDTDNLPWCPWKVVVIGLQTRAFKRSEKRIGHHASRFFLNTLF